MHAQNASEIKVQARVMDGKIKLRWGVTTPIGWHYVQKYGFTIERSTILEGGKVVQEKVFKTLTPQPIKPAVLPDWEPYMDDDYVAIAAQSIYGESFQPQSHSSAMVQMINTAKEQENRFSFLMFAADQSVKAAELAGLYYEDEETHIGEKYLYRVYSNVPPTLHQLDTGIAYIGLADNEPLPQPRDVKVSFDDRVAVVSWNSSIYTKHYNAFWVQKSSDGGQTYKSLTDKPVITTVRKEGSLNERAYKLDSLEANDQEYLYRVLGVSAFGELSPPSEPAGGSGVPAFKTSPSIKSHEILKSGEVILHWSFSEKYRHLVKSFVLKRQRKDKTTYDTVKEGLPPSPYQVMDSNPRSSNYYVIEAQDNYGRATASFPYFVQLEDSIPPSPPTNLEGAIDTTGTVTITWQPSVEEDVYGYKVFKSNFEDAEFIQLPGEVLTTNRFTEKIRINNLTETIYYRVIALDNRFNPSEYSEILKLKKPDKIPPVTPVVEKASNDSLGILLQWQPSPSDDVVKYVVYRQAQTDADWTLVAVKDRVEEGSFFYDQEVEHGERYAYIVLAVDDDGLESEPSKPTVALWKDRKGYPPVRDLAYQVTDKRAVQISWAYSEEKLQSFYVYKATEGESYRLFREVAADQRAIQDTFPYGKGTVRYKVMATMTTGERSQMSKELKVIER